jgi:hypothetical protein
MRRARYANLRSGPPSLGPQGKRQVYFKDYHLKPVRVTGPRHSSGG